MTDRLDFKIDGLEELQKKFKNISDDMEYKGGRFALRKAAQVIRDDAKQGAARVDDPATAENISRNIAERWSTRRFRATKDLMFRVGVLGGAGGNLSKEEITKNPGGDTRYWRLIEFGTEKMPAQPFMRPAAKNAGQKAVNKFVTEYGKKLGRLTK